MAENTAGYLAIEIKIDDSNVAEEIRAAASKAEVAWKSAFHLRLGRDDLSSILADIQTAETAFNKMSASRKAAFTLDFDKDVKFDPFSEAIASADTFRGSVLSATGQISVINAKAQEAHQRFGVMANAVTGASTVLRLFGAAEGMAVVETGRVVLYLGRATTAAGGFAAALATIQAATLAFIASLPPLAIAIAAVAAAMAAAKVIFDASAAAEERAEKRASDRRDRMEEEAAAIRQRNAALRDAEDAFAVIKGSMSEQTAQELKSLRGGTPAQDAAKIAQLAENGRVWLEQVKAINEQWELGEKQESEAREGLNRRLLDEMGFHAKRVDLENEASQKIADDNYNAFIKGNERVEQARQNSIVARISKLDQLRERRAEMLQEAVGTGQGTSSLGPSGNAFRFGPGAMGSTIGAETEQKKTNNILERIDQKIADLNTSLTAEGSDAKFLGYEH
jgi:hypothetical protein